MKKHITKPTWQAPIAQAKTNEKKQQSDQPQPIGNFAPNALMDSVTTAPSSELPVQAKLTIGQVGDQYEQEADAVAAKVVQQINTPSSDAAQAKGEEQVQLKPALQRQDLGGGTAAPELESEINHAKGGGQALDKGLQRSMGNAMGMDLSHVKVHTDNTSHQLNQSLQAKAFTTGQDVFFGKGQYQPGSKSGQELIAHELTHVGQQGGANVQRQTDTLVQCGLGDKVKQWWEGLFTKEPRKQCSASKQQGIKYIKACKKYPPFQKWKASHFAQINKAGNIKILDQTMFEIFCYYSELEYSTENTNALLLMSKTNLLKTEQLLAVCELFLNTVQTKKYRSYLPSVDYVSGVLPENLNLPYDVAQKAEVAMQDVEQALLGKNPSETMAAHMKLGDAVGKCVKEAYGIISTDTIMRFRKTSPEALFPDAAAFLADLKKVKGGALKAKIMSGMTESEDLEYAETKKKQQEEIERQM